MKLLKMRLTNFKGFTGEEAFEIDFYNKTVIEGRNAVGKSTIMTAHLWLWLDRDCELKSNPDIRPNDGRKCIPRVEEEWEIDGRKVTIAKYQISKTATKNGKETKSISNKYEINNRPLSRRDFEKELTALGFDFDHLLETSHAQWFLKLKDDEQRKILFGMTKSKTDLEIATMTDKCMDVAELLKNYRLDEIEAMNKASKKKATEQLDAIPNQIIGKEGAKVSIDVPALEARKTEIIRQISEIEKSLSGSSESLKESDKLADEIRKLKSELSNLSDKENSEIRKKREDLDSNIVKLQHDKRIASDDLRMAEDELKRNVRDIEAYTEALKKAQADYTYQVNLEFDDQKIRDIEAEEFDEKSLICPTCGQEYPEEKAQKIREDFESGKIARLEEQERLRKDFYEQNDKKVAEITESGNRAKKGLRNAKEKKGDSEKSIQKYEKYIAYVTSEIEKLSSEMEKLPYSADLSGNEGYIKIQNQIAENESKLSTMNQSDYRKQKEAELKEKRSELSMVESELAKVENNKRIDDQIAELRRKQREYAQKKADAERILHQIDSVNRAKNTVLEKEVNSWFRIVRVKLFRYLKNGEYDKCCVFEVLNEKTGEWFEIGKSANTALEVMGKMDIISGLQRFYGKSYPVFVDGAECLDSESMKMVQTDYQTIFLRVTNGNLEVKEIA